MTDWLLGEEEVSQRVLPRGVTYDAAAHRYYLDGAWIPNVSTILSELKLSDFSGVSPETLEAARQRGTTAHEVLEQIICGTYSDQDYEPLFQRYAVGICNFLRRTKFQPRHVEHLVVSRKLRFGGRLDLQGIFNNEEAILDAKTGEEHHAYKLQTAGYDIAFCEQEKRAPQKRYLLLLTGEVDGGRDGYRLVHHNDRQDLDVFRMALFLYNWKMKG